MLPNITLIEEPTDITPSKVLPYSMMGLAGLIILYSFTSGSKKDEQVPEDVDEEVEDTEENEEEVK